MSTIGDYLESIASYYKEHPALEGNELTKYDFLAMMAQNISMARCGDKSECLFQEADLYKKNPDRYIDEVLSQKGTSKRACYEKKAQDLLRLTGKFLSSKEAYDYNNQLLVNMRSITETPCK